MIAEAAATHDGSLGNALRLVDLAADIGADAVKFQWLSSAVRLCDRRRAPEYLAAYSLLVFPEDRLARLAVHAAVRGIAFMCTAYLPEDVPVVARYVDRFKVSSFEVLDASFVALHAAWPKPLVISAGMGADVRPSVAAWCREYGPRPVPRVDVLHCVSAYPAPDDQLNLIALRPNSYSLRSAPTGFSDHAVGVWSGAVAVAAGARVLEFHVRLTLTSPTNADYAVSRSPHDAREYVQNVRLVERMLGHGTPGSAVCEEAMLRYRVDPAVADFQGRRTGT